MTGIRSLIPWDRQKSLSFAEHRTPWSNMVSYRFALVASSSTVQGASMRELAPASTVVSCNVNPARPLYSAPFVQPAHLFARVEPSEYTRGYWERGLALPWAS